MRETHELGAAAPQACAHCPWRLANQGTPHPHGFYTKRNLARLWAGLRSGEAPGMTCHPTDPRMAEFEGYEENAERDVTLECRGAIVLVVREVMRFQAICHQVEAGDLAGPALRAYRQQAPKGLTRDGLAEAVSRFLLGATPLAREIQCDSRQVNDEAIGYPPLGEWDPSILDDAMAMQAAG
jgi:hypothetical protein